MANIIYWTYIASQSINCNINTRTQMQLNLNINVRLSDYTKNVPYKKTNNNSKIQKPFNITIIYFSPN